MTRDAVQQQEPEGAVSSAAEPQLPPHRVPVPFAPDVLDGPTWLRGGPHPLAAPAPALLSALAEGASVAGAAASLSVAAAGGASVPPAPVTGRDVAESAMRAVVEIDAAIASLEAMRVRFLAGIGHVAVGDALEERLDPGVGVRDAACELALMGRRSDRTVEADIGHAMEQVTAWPATLEAWGAARIHRGHVGVITEIGSTIPDPAARAAFEAALIPHAERTTPSRLRAVARRELEQHLERPLAARHRSARDRRGVFQKELDDGMSRLELIAPTVLVAATHDRLTQMAKATLRAADASGEGKDPRTFDQLRADLLCDLLLTGDPAGVTLDAIRADITIVMPAEVLAGVDERDTDRDAADDAACDAGDDAESRAAGTLDGGTASTTGGSGFSGRRRDDRRRAASVARLATGAPVDPETARRLAERATAWTRLFTDPRTGHVTAVDTSAPSKRLTQLLRARDQRCRWPGCTQAAHRSDLDHTIPWAAGGTTDTGNLAHLCRRHHTLKGARLSGARRWKVEQRSPGVLAFTSPGGQAYVDEPPQIGPVFRERAADAWGVTSTERTGSLPF
ncbi:DUF222 domain-containing protein [Agrococcus sp. 1P02AA]|uniref:HNH endonuclease signature motif containing protein n=1 Tax=Agrococcus sp. 1P02AA TaxID=3132259 RepID=UPI0039A49A24